MALKVYVGPFHRTAKKGKSLYYQGQSLDVRQPLLTLISLNVSLCIYLQLRSWSYFHEVPRRHGTSLSATPSHLEPEAAEERRIHLTGGITSG